MDYKVCLSCNQNKPFSSYETRKRKNGTSGYRIHCTSCRSKISIRKLRQKLFEYLKTHFCVDCGESDPTVLHFDHIKDKSQNISDMIQHKCSWNKILNEISKCEVRCANCHARKTAKQQGWYDGLI